MKNKNSDIKIRMDLETKELIKRAIEKLESEFTFKITQPDFMRSAAIDYSKNILAGKIQLSIQRT